MAARLKRLLFALMSMAVSAILSIGPVLFVRRGLNQFFDYWQENVFFGLCMAAGFLSAGLGMSLVSGLKETRRQRLLVWGSLLFGFLYVASAVLCQRLSVGILFGELWKNVGLALFALGITLRLWAIATLRHLHSGYVTIQNQHELITGGPYRRLRHPSYLGALIAAAGVPLIFGAWFPLLALPGIFVALKWRMDDEEALLAEHFGSQYDEYKKQRWRLLPYVY